MLKSLFLTGTCLLAVFQSFAQDCIGSVYLQSDKTIEWSVTNKKGESDGKRVFDVSHANTSGNTRTATITSTASDKNGNTLATISSMIECVGGTFMIDMRFLLQPREAQQVANSAKGQSFYLEYPAGIKVGDALKDGSMTIQLDGGPPGAGPAGGQGGPPGHPPGPPFGSPSHLLSLLISNRKVDGQESITTPAGTWNCFRISYKSKLSVKTGPFGFPMTTECTEWFAPGVGVVKSQTKNQTLTVTSIK